VSFTRIVTFSKQYLNCNALRAYCMRRSYVGNFQIFDSGNSEKHMEL